VDYFESELMPGQPMFRCDRLSASIRVVSCVGMWAEANSQGGVPERLFRCRACPVGAQHSGEGDASYHRLRGVSICARCHRTDLRLIGGNVCVGCKNREYEWVKGKNAKGQFPKLHPVLAKRRVVYAVGGEVRVLVRELTAGTDELVVELLRDSTRRVVMGLGRGGVMNG
jgi:hypothetical protein